MLQKNLIRLVIVLALSLLLISLFSGVYGDRGSRLYQTVRDGLSSTKGGAFSSEKHKDISGLLQKLSDGHPEFDWVDWLDLDSTELFEKKSLSAKAYPYLSKLKKGQEPAMPYEVHASPEEQAMIARIYCKHHLTSPFRVVPLGDPRVLAHNGSESANVILSDDNLRSGPMTQYRAQHVNKDRLHFQHGHHKPTEYYEASEPLMPDLKTKTSELSRQDLLFPKVDGKLFSWDADTIVKQRNDDGNNDDIHVDDHAYSVWKATGYAPSSPKYFHEVWIKDDPAGYGVHYDWRFFRGILVYDQHRAATHFLARAWQQFAEQMGVIYWFAHGSLLGYHWDGLTMPWDSDHDIQVPVMELDRLARDFNRTLVVQNTAEGQRKYLVDVAPSYVQRAKGNGNNLIDARFIDVDSGAYIDITGLARISANSLQAACKNRHSYKVEALSRLRRTAYEGYPSLMPLNYEPWLQKEYKAWANPAFKRWKFNSKTRLWEFKQTCKEYLKGFKNSRHVYCIPRDFQQTPDCGEKYGTCDQLVIKSFNETHVATGNHNKEAAIMKEIGNPITINDWESLTAKMDELLSVAGEYIPPFRTGTESSPSSDHDE